MPYMYFATTGGHETISSNEQVNRRDALSVLVKITYIQPKKTLILLSIHSRRDVGYLIESPRVGSDVTT